MHIDNSQGSPVILATGGYDHTVKLWQTHSGICYRTYHHPDCQVNALEITPNKQQLAVANYQHILIYDLMSNNSGALLDFEGTFKNVTSVGFQMDGRWMYTGSEDCKARIWDLLAKSNQCIKIYDAKAPITSVCLHPNQVELYISDQAGVIHRWDLKSDQNEQFIPETDSMIFHLAIDPKGNYMAAVNNHGRCYVWSLRSDTLDGPTKLNPIHKFKAHDRHTLKCRFSPDSKYLVTTSADQTARVWHVNDFTLKQELKQENQRWVWDAAFSGDSQYVFTASSDCYAKIWNIDAGVVEKEYAGHQKAVTALAFKDSVT